MISNRNRFVFARVAWSLILLLGVDRFGVAQSTKPPGATLAQSPASVSGYLDQTTGMTADEAVEYALAHNAELDAARKEIDAAKAIVKQARLRANPMLEVEGKRQVPPGRDNTVMAGVTLPLELNGRVPTRIAVAEREVEVRARGVANRQRIVAGEIRMKFGEALAAALKLSFTNELLEANQRS